MMYAVTLSLTLLHAATFAGDYPQWRGPGRDGVVHDSPPLAESWPEAGPKLLWKSEPVPGGQDGGFSSPSISDGKVYILAQRCPEYPFQINQKLLDELHYPAPDMPQDLIDRAVALEVAPNPDALKMALKGIAVAQPGIL